MSKATIDRKYTLLPKDEYSNGITPTKITPFNGIDQALVINQTKFSGHFDNEFTIQMWMKHANDNNNKNDKEHIFCKTDEKCMLNSIGNSAKNFIYFFFSKKSSSQCFIYSK